MVPDDESRSVASRGIVGRLFRAIRRRLGDGFLGGFYLVLLGGLHVFFYYIFAKEIGVWSRVC